MLVFWLSSVVDKESKDRLSCPKKNKLGTLKNHVAIILYFLSAMSLPHTSKDLNSCSPLHVVCL
jgi:hypothetical protein